MLSSRNKPVSIIDLYSGAGGLTLGFSRFSNGQFRPVWANDYNGDAVRTYNKNFGNHCVHGDIVHLLKDRKIKIPHAELVIGGPPCQGFSLLNKQREEDQRKELWRPFMQVVLRCKAKAFVMENVPQLLGSPERLSIEKAAARLGFKTVSAKLCAADYGVPQVRHRAFIIGWKGGDPGKFFPALKTHFDPKQGLSMDRSGYVSEPRPWVSVKEAIEMLPAPIGTEIRSIASPLDLHFGRKPTPMSLQRYRAISYEGMNRFDLQRIAPELTPKCWIRKTSGGTDLFGRLWWNRPAFTIRTEFYKPEKGRYLHPQQHRPITFREAARFQSFPDDFNFTGSKIEIAKQIGNAVPPLLAAKVADCVFEMLRSRKSK